MSPQSPRISIVIASLNGQAYLAACLNTLTKQEVNVPFEIIVVDGVGGELPNFVRTKFPSVRLIACAPPKTVAELRAIGFQQAQGNIVALTEDHCLLPPDWLQKLHDLHEQYLEVAIGGCVLNGALDTVADRLAYVCEYGNFMAVPAGRATNLPGPNVSYKKSALANIGSEFWEGHFHAQLQAQGHALRSDPSLQVTHKKHFTLKHYLHERFHYSRWFAGHRVTDSPLTKQLFYLAATPILPLLIFARLVRRLDQSNWYLAPLIALVALVATVGELVGYAAGVGNSAYYLK